MTLVRDTVSLTTGELIHSEVIEEDKELDIKPLVCYFVTKIIENEKSTKGGSSK